MSREQESMMTELKPIYLLVLSGKSDDAHKFVTDHYPGQPITVLSKRQLREGDWRTQIRQLRAMRGEALVIFSSSLSDLREPLLFLCSGFVHRCRETVLADAKGRSRVCPRWRLGILVPAVFLGALLDILVLASAWMCAHTLLHRLRKQEKFRPRVDGELDIALLDPSFEPATAGGAMSYLDGTLSGLANEPVSCEIFSGRQFSFDYYPVHVVPSRRRLFLFRECQSLSYNLRFALSVWKKLRRRVPRLLYQRHGRFVFVGALLSWLTRTPLVLEYQGSEVWLAKNWDPARFRPWLALCERVSIAASSHIVVLSEASRDELLACGYPPQRIILNPAAVDPERFHPACGGQEVRRQLGVAPHHTLVSFAGSFSYYHGIPVLARAITTLLKRRSEGSVLENLRFMLIGDGLLRAETEGGLSEVEGSEAVIFTGLVPHKNVPAYLDASDILVSPQIPNADGTPFFGSPTKLFEYMAMEKAIVASDLDQLSRVLCHGSTAWIVTPGSDAELAKAIEYLAGRPELCSLLGRNARAAALQRHTWRQNAIRLLSQTDLPLETKQRGGTRSNSSAVQRGDLPFQTTRERS
jgi:glycosyltransferase involved in cell wall biosynthesis